jgi:hypothetical protein
MQFTARTHGSVVFIAAEPVDDREGFALALKTLFRAHDVYVHRDPRRYVVGLTPSVMLANGQRLDDLIDAQIPDEYR